MPLTKSLMFVKCISILRLLGCVYVVCLKVSDLSITCGGMDFKRIIVSQWNIYTVSHTRTRASTRMYACMHSCSHTKQPHTYSPQACAHAHRDQDPSSRTNSLSNHCWLSGQSFVGSLNSSENCSVMLLCLMCCCMWCIVYVGVCRQRTMTDAHWGTNSCSRRPVSVTSNGDSIASRNVCTGHLSSHTLSLRWVCLFVKELMLWWST